MKKRKKVLLIMIAVCTMFCLCGCSQKKPSVVKTYEKTDSEQAWKAAGFSSNMDDYFDVEVAKFVGFGAGTVDHSEDIYIYEDTNVEGEELGAESSEYVPAENKALGCTQSNLKILSVEVNKLH